MEGINWPPLLRPQEQSGPGRVEIRAADTPLPAAWIAGQLLEGQVLQAQGERLLLALADANIWVEWIQAPAPPPGTRLQLKVLGREGGRWFLRPQVESAIPEGERLLWLLEQLDLPLSYRNVKYLSDLLAGKTPGPIGERATAAQELCPLNEDVWQQLCGFLPVSLTAAFFTWRPFSLALLVEEDKGGQSPPEQEGQGLKFLLALAMPYLGRVDVVVLGPWGRLSIIVVAREEIVTLLEKRKKELYALLQEMGGAPRELSFRCGDRPLVNLPRGDMVPYRGLDQRV